MPGNFCFLPLEKLAVVLWKMQATWRGCVQCSLAGCSWVPVTDSDISSESAVLCVLHRQTFSSLWTQLPFDINHNTELCWTRWSENQSPSVMSDFLRSHGLYSPWNSLGRNSGVGSLSLLQGIFLTQGSNPSLSHCRCILYQLSHKRSPRILEWVAYSFSSGSSRLRNQTGIEISVHTLRALRQPKGETNITKNWDSKPQTGE